MYSRRRLILLGLGWVVAAAAAFALFPSFTVDAGGGGCNASPCAFPAENYDGGIVMGGTRLYAETTGCGSPPCNAGDCDCAMALEWIPDVQVKLPYTDATGEMETVSWVGTGKMRGDVFPVQDMLIYKSWRYKDPQTQQRENAYIWMNASTASVDFIDSTGYGWYDNQAETDCGDDGTGENALDCALRVSVSEISSEYLEGRGCTGFWSICSTLSTQDYWIPIPSDDTCGLLSFTLCLELGGSQGNYMYSEDFMFRIHAATQESHNGFDKEMILTNMYMEIRYDRGTTRAHTPPPYNDPDFAKPADGSALGNSFDCEGNPSAGTPCDVDDDDGNPPPMVPYESYEDPY